MSKHDSLTLTRTGSFTFQTVGDKHCGPAPAGQEQECKYTVRVKCNPVLDNDGYLFEQLVVQQYFDSIKKVKSTCEVLAMRCADELVDVCVRQHPNIEINWIEVSLSAYPYAASMTFRFHP